MNKMFLPHLARYIQIITNASSATPFKNIIDLLLLNGMLAVLICIPNQVNSMYDYNQKIVLCPLLFCYAYIFFINCLFPHDQLINVPLIY